ncbi:hypothetical protein SAMN05421805_11847 [Saccharopolyspora antimicrobica]|uniref:Uncharacterized protein n=1 Tax=Saccharopolyspora antimicrobica TaxID=455193 RepID=A0A1I5IBR0_9PSEU|nr:hypothetical protein [Saccharopolyspora antimicrobica]RKT85551.1 hypothetical protein ATL45_3898 [Saccharopolyspora antimicrobica]SFO57952.1 hypothetical protein SAMN05421805_11847 [Saccharopolyspora antimicrobica]
MTYNLEHLVLSARSWWCKPGEPITWAFPDPFHIPLFEVAGLDEHGKRKRGLAARALFQAGALSMRVSAVFNSVDEQADDRNSPSAIVSARDADSLAVRMSGTSGDKSPGEKPGILVATPTRLALLEIAEFPEGSRDWLDKGMDKVMQVTGPVGRFADDFAGAMHSTINSKGRFFDHGEQVQTPEVVEKACIGADQVTGYDVGQRNFRRPGYDKDDRSGNYLQITFADQSRLDLRIPSKADPNRALQLARNTLGGSTW